MFHRVRSLLTIKNVSNGQHIIRNVGSSEITQNQLESILNCVDRDLNIFLISYETEYYKRLETKTMLKPMDVRELFTFKQTNDAMKKIERDEHFKGIVTGIYFLICCVGGCFIVCLCVMRHDQ